MKPRKPILPYKVGTCIDCNCKLKKTMSKRCIEEPNFCYQKHQKDKYLQKQKEKNDGLSNPIRRLPEPNPDKHKTIPELLKLATIVFNKWIRTRDTKGGTHFTCISCSNTYTTEVLQCGHYKPSTYSKLRFEEINCHSECEQCNCHDPNHLIGYRINLINKIGVANVNWLESHKIAENYKWDRDELLDIIQKYKL